VGYIERRKVDDKLCYSVKLLKCDLCKKKLGKMIHFNSDHINQEFYCGYCIELIIENKKNFGE
jgi:hypothetical protein